MKNFKKMLCIVLVLILCFASAVPASAATAKYTKASNAYKSWLKKYSTPLGRYYDIVDIDGNGIPEFLVTDFADSRVFTYDYAKKKMVLLKKLGAGRSSGVGKSRITYNTKKKMFTMVTSDTQSSTTYFFKVKGKKITKAATYSYRFTQSAASSRIKYYINNKAYSYSTYKKKLKSASKGYKNMRYSTTPIRF